MRRIKTQADGHENLDRWLLTYADMITLLTAFILMLYSMSVVSRGKFSALATSVRSGFNNVCDHDGISSSTAGIAGSPGHGSAAVYRQYQQNMRDLQRYVEQNQLGEQVNVHSDERGTVISLVADGMLFARGSATLQPESRPLLAHVAQILKEAPDNNVQVEGHTDNVPIHTSQFPSNWELSTARAAILLRTLMEGADALPAKRFNCSGYADTRPLVANDTEAHRSQNRRVDIVLLKTSMQQEAGIIRHQEVQRILSVH